MTVAAPGLPPQRWLAAESCWAESFHPPGYLDLLRWSLVAVPYVMAFHAFAPLRAAFAPINEAPTAREFFTQLRSCFIPLLVALLRFPVLLALSPLFVFTLLLALMFGWIPKIRDAFLWLQRLLTATLGDSLALVSGHLNRAAIETRVRADLDFLLFRCRRVAVVAHSQGAAISHAVIRTHPSEKISLFYSFGSGLSKLWALGQMRSARGLARIWLAPLGFLLMLPFLLRALRLEYEWLSLLPPFLIYIIAAAIAGAADLGGKRFIFRTVFIISVLVSAVGIIWFFYAFIKSSPLAAFSLFAGAYFAARGLGGIPTVDANVFATSLALPPSIRWRDVFSTHDPVPNGPLTRFPNSRIAPEEIPILQSTLSDHTAYFDAADVFSLDLAAELSRAAQLPPPPAAAHLQASAHRRHFRTSLRKLSRLVLAMLSVPLAWRFASLPHPYLADPALAILSGFNPGQLLPQPLLAKTLAPFLSSSAAGAAAFLLVLIAAALLQAIWRFWDRSEQQALLSGAHLTPTHPALIVFLILFAFAVDLILLAASAWPLWTREFFLSLFVLSILLPMLPLVATSQQSPRFASWHTMLPLSVAAVALHAAVLFLPLAALFQFTSPFWSTERVFYAALAGIAVEAVAHFFLASHATRDRLERWTSLHPSLKSAR